MSLTTFLPAGLDDAGSRAKTVILGLGIASAAAALSFWLSTGVTHWGILAAIAVAAIFVLKMRHVVALPLFGLVALCLIGPVRMDQGLLDARLETLPPDVLVRTAFYLLPGAGSYYPELALLIVFAALVLVAGPRSFGCTHDWIMEGSLLAFVAYASFDLVRAPHAGIDVPFWAREFVPILALLLIFPLSAIFVQKPWTMRYLTVRMLVLLLVFVVHSGYVSLVAGIDDDIRLTEAAPYNTLPFAPVCCVLLLGQILSGSPSARWWRVLRWLILGAAGCVVILSATRIALIATIAGTAFAVVCSARYGGDTKRRLFHLVKPFAAFAGVVLLLGLAYIVYGSAMRERMEGGLQESSAASRFVENRAAINKFIRSPLIGSGLGSMFVFEDTIGWEPWPYVHNGYLYYLADLGAIGLFFYAVFCAGLIRSSWRNIRQVPLSKLSYFLGGGSAIVVLLVYSAVQASYRSFQNSILLAFAAALCTAAVSPSRAVAPFKGDRPAICAE